MKRPESRRKADIPPGGGKRRAGSVWPQRGPAAAQEEKVAYFWFSIVTSLIRSHREVSPDICSTFCCRVISPSSFAA